MTALDGISGIVLGAIFGSVFVVTCIISAIKAISDRSHMKKRIVIREKEKLENGYVDEKKEAITTSIQYDSNRCQPLYFSNNRLCIGTTCSTGSVDHLNLSMYSTDAGENNLAFQHNNTNIQYAEENHQKLIAAADIAPPCQRLVSNRDKAFRQERNLEDNWTDFLSIDSIEKIMRRRSYEIAVCENSWLSKGQPRDSTSQALLDTSGCKNNVKNSTKAPKVAFENKAFDIVENKTT